MARYSALQKLASTMETRKRGERRCTPFRPCLSTLQLQGHQPRPCVELTRRWQESRFSEANPRHAVSCSFPPVPPLSMYVDCLRFRPARIFVVMVTITLRNHEQPRMGSTTNLHHLCQCLPFTPCTEFPGLRVRSVNRRWRKQQELARLLTTACRCLCRTLHPNSGTLRHAHLKYHTGSTVINFSPRAQRE